MSSRILSKPSRNAKAPERDAENSYMLMKLNMKHISTTLKSLEKREVVQERARLRDYLKIYV